MKRKKYEGVVAFRPWFAGENMLNLNRWMLILFTGAALLGVTGTALAGDSVWPTSPRGWWKSLRGGESATYEMVMGQTVIKVVTTINKVEGSKITLTTQDQEGKTTMPAQQETIDAAITDVGALPLGASVRKGKSITVEVENNSFKCTIYHVEINGIKMENCRSSRLPPIFNSGVVKMKAESEDGYRTTLILKKYTGALLKNVDENEKNSKTAERSNRHSL